MEPQYAKLLQYAAAAPMPLRFRVTSAGNAEELHVIDSSYAIFGRTEGCQVLIPDQTVSQRHAYVQALGQHVAWIDLLSTSGLKHTGPPFAGWLSPEHQMQVGGATVQLMNDGWTVPSDLKGPLDFRPRDEQRPEYGVLPQVNLELLNTNAKGKRWPINRIITLMGRDDRCRITIVDQRIARVQCALLLLPTGLWVIDLFGQGGISVNGHECPCALLSAGTELSIGPYLLSAHYPQVEVQAASIQAADQSQVSDFLTRPNKLFQTEFYYNTLIVVPVGDSRTFYYQDMHIEASRVIDLIKQYGYQHLVVDFSRCEQIGHMALEILMTMCRSTPGKAALCGANQDTLPVLQKSSINRLYPHYSNRADALQVLYTSG